MSRTSLQVISDLKKQFADQLSEIGFLNRNTSIRSMGKQKSDGILEFTGQDYNRNSENIKIIRAIIFAGLYPKLVKIDVPDQKFHQILSGSIAVSSNVREYKFHLKSKGWLIIFLF